MLCARCEKMLAELTKGQPQAPWSELAESLAMVPCTRCGATILPADAERVLRTKLSQLSRFGLGADDRPLLKGFSED